jgi:hypothetical protein
MSLCFYTDGPPLPDNAHGNHGIAKCFIRILASSDFYLLTRRYRRSYSRQSIAQACGSTPVLFHPDSSPLGLRKFFPSLACVIDITLFFFWLPVLFLQLRRRNIERIFVLCGADAWFLFNLWLLQCLGIPMDLYLVDDIETSTAHGHNQTLQKIVTPLLHSVLKRSSRVYAISPGFVEHLEKKHHITATWLPLPAPDAPPALASETSHDRSRSIVFIGGLNHLYIDALQDLYGALCLWNQNPKRDFSLHLEIISYGSTQAFLNSLPNQDWVLSHEKLPDTVRLEKLKKAYACFLPYSFKEEERLMVSTSFSCKILEYFQSGRPIMVYGPSYASIPRYFRAENLPLCATTKEELDQVLNQINSYQASDLMPLYQQLWEKYHSPRAIKKYLSLGP